MQKFYELFLLVPALRGVTQMCTLMSDGHLWPSGTCIERGTRLQVPQSIN
jgi:hypothetical protein